GRGTEDVVPKLDWEKLRGRPQRVLGFSNITWLLNAMLKEKTGHPFSGPTLDQIALQAETKALAWLSMSLGGGPLPRRTSGRDAPLARPQTARGAVPTKP
ncbi:MAG: LD-carboxypeptidase, partial [Kiritimatiellae bacterium]|nr:LD-carboxypeptidase [Kiritimatiellia bacterium]